MSYKEYEGAPRSYKEAFRELHMEHLRGNWSRIFVGYDRHNKAVEVYHNLETGETCVVLWWLIRNHFQIYDMLERFKDGSNVRFVPPTDEQLNELTDDEEIELIKRLMRDRNSPNI